MNKPVLMLHECGPDFLKLPLEQYLLTFDDGLYSQFVFYQEIRQIPTEKIFFISSGIVCEGPQSTEFPSCKQAHEKAFKGNKEDYMTLEQIQFLAEDPLVTIGAHSHTHTRLNKFNTLAEKARYIKNDTEQMLEWFETNLGQRPTSFCFPYNENLDGLYSGMLKKYGFTDFYGNERTPVETLLRTQTLPESLDILTAWSLPRYF